MGIINYFRSKKTDTASIARQRLQIIVAHERSSRNQPDYLPQLQREIVDVINKYINISPDQVSMNIDRAGDCSVLELNVTLDE